MELDRALRADRILLTPAIWNPAEPRAYDLPRRVTVRVGRQEFSATLPPRITKTVLSFGRSLPIKRLRVTILDWHKGKRHRGRGGLAEIELQDARPRRSGRKG